MITRKMLGLAVLASSIGWIGCGDDNGGGGDGPIALEKADTGMAASYTCEPTAPAGGGEVAFTLEVLDFQDEFPVIGACVNFYGDNNIPMNDTCDGMMTDADGNLDVVDPDGGWYAYRIFAGENTETDPAQAWVGTVQKNEEVPGAGETAVGNSVSQNTVGLIPAVLGLTQDPEDAVVSGAVLDCDADLVAGAAVRVVRNGQVIPPMSGATDAHYEYFDGAQFPQQDRSATNTDGLFIGVNIPIDTEGEEVLVISCGQEEGLLGCESTRAFRNTVNIINVGPLRSDGPAACDTLSANICDGVFN